MGAQVRGKLWLLVSSRLLKLYSERDLPGDLVTGQSQTLIWTETRESVFLTSSCVMVMIWREPTDHILEHTNAVTSHLKSEGAGAGVFIYQLLVVIRWGLSCLLWPVKWLSLTWRESSGREVQIPAVGSLLWVVQSQLHLVIMVICTLVLLYAGLSDLRAGALIHLLAWQHLAHVMLLHLCHEWVDCCRSPLW